MSAAGKNARKVAPKKVKYDLNSTLKTVAKSKDSVTNAKDTQGAKSPDMPKEVLLTFYDKLLINKHEDDDMPPKTEEVVVNTPETGLARTTAKSRQRRACKTSGELPIPCTSDLCSKVRQLVQMNNQVERFKKKFLEMHPASMDEKRALQQRKFEIGNEYSRRNAMTSRKGVPRMDKIQNALIERCGGNEKVKWDTEDVITCEGLEEDVERKGGGDYLLELQGSFVDCFEDDLPSSADSFSETVLAAIRTERQYDTDYSSCTDTTREKTSTQSPGDLVRKSSSAKMLIHFRELLSMHILPKSVNEVKCSILCDEDVAFLKNLVEADERYRYLKQEDHKLLKEILQTQLKQIEAQERILADTLKKLRQKTGSSEAVAAITRNPSKEKAEQPLEKSPREIELLHNNSEGPEISALAIDLADDRSIDQVDKMCNSPENMSSKQESTGTSSFRSALKGLEDNWSCPSLFESDLVMLNKIHLDLVAPPVSPSKDNILENENRPANTLYESSRSNAFRRSEENLVNIEDSLEESSPTRSCEMQRLIPLLDIDQFQNDSIKEFFTKSLNPYSKTKLQQDETIPKLVMDESLQNTSTPRDQIHLLKVVSVRSEKFVKTENLEKEITDKTVRFDDKNSYRKNILGTPRSCQNHGDDTVCLDDSEIQFANLASTRIQYEDIKDSAKLVSKKATPEKLSKTVQTLEHFEENSVNLEVKSNNVRNKQIMECVDIKGTAKPSKKSPREKIRKATGEHLEDRTKLFVDKACSCSDIEKSAKDQNENNRSITYITTLVEHMIFWEHVATVEVRPLCILRQRCVVKEFKMKYLPVENMKNAGEFYILHSENSKIKIEKTCFEKLHQQPEKLTKLLQPMYKQAVDKAVSTNEHEYKYFYPCQLSDYPVPEDIMIQNVICCLFKTWATNPELYKQAISNCGSVPNALPQPSSKENSTPDDHDPNIAIGENKRESELNVVSGDRTEFSEVQQQETFLETNLIKKSEDYETPLEKRMKVKNLVVFGAQILLFMVLVVGLSMYEYRCLEL